MAHKAFKTKDFESITLTTQSHCPDRFASQHFLHKATALHAQEPSQTEPTGFSAYHISHSATQSENIRVYCLQMEGCLKEVSLKIFKNYWSLGIPECHSALLQLFLFVFVEHAWVP